MKGARAQEGFTLVEVLVALVIMAVLSGLAWQGLDAVLKAREASREKIDRTSRLLTVMTQWQQDLGSVFDTTVAPAISFDGQTLRLTRRVPDGVALVTWAVRGGVWQRWSSAPLQRVAALQESWIASQQFQGSEPGQLKAAEGVSEWQIYFHRGSEWSNAQSTGNLVQGPAGAASGAAPVVREELPNAVRLVLTINGQKLTRDIALGPAGS